MKMTKTESESTHKKQQRKEVEDENKRELMQAHGSSHAWLSKERPKTKGEAE